jgi:VIT1/CCC1 family predicted Fe2+/Mn2+ transporter
MAQEYNHQLTTAISFGLTSGVISSIGMIVGLQSATGSRLVVISGIVIMAIADGLADSAGIHMSEEAEFEKGRSKHTSREVWMTTILTLFSVLGIVMTFVVPILVLPLNSAVIVAVAWGFLLLVLLNYHIAKIKGEKPISIIAEHLLLAIALIIISNLTGTLLAAALR